MNTNKMAPTGAVTPKGAMVEGCQGHSNTATTLRQGRISGLLRHGGENATPRRELAQLLRWDDRAVTRAIERERRAGTPIMANGRGYFLPANDYEVDEYLKCLLHRETEVRKTRLAVAQTRQLHFDMVGGDANGR